MTLSWPQESDQAQVSETLLSDQSLLLILVLVNHCTREDALYNPYREALLSFSSSHGAYMASKSLRISLCSQECIHCVFMFPF